MTLIWENLKTDELNDKTSRKKVMITQVETGHELQRAQKYNKGSGTK